PDALRTVVKKAEQVKTTEITSQVVRKLHHAGHSVEKIYNGVARKVGSQQAKKLMAAFVDNLRRVPDKVGVSEVDRAFLIGKLGMRPETVRMLDPLRRPTN